MKALCLYTMVAATLVIAACHRAAPPDIHDADCKAIRDTDEQLNRAYASKNLDQILSYYTDDAVLAVTGGSALRGKDVIRKDMTPLMSDPTYSLAIKASKVDVAKSGDLGYSEGTYVYSSTDRATHAPKYDHGTYLNIFKKQADGTWKAEDLIATSEVAQDTSAR